MNERIQQLKDKLWTEEYWTNPNTDRLLPAQLNRFAELILKECTDVLMQRHEESKHSHNYYHVTANMLKNHFGVE